MKQRKNYFRWILVIGWMVVIFLFSNDPADISNEKSDFIINLVNILGIDLNSTLGELANFIVRKIAHFTEYFILYLLVFNALRNDFYLRKALIISLIITFIYACSDEIHQIFIPGREGMFRDVLIDTLGGVFALVIISLYKKFRGKVTKKSC
ncbi:MULTISPECIES: VanZ family protein [Clostridium]|uniref:VanZ like family protein n=2 Tax=Clostridium TaxID=1485 RepID=A0A151AKU3_9CLOT|nr:MULTISPECIES: VanZ family protein [Clostridium]KYH28279.1 VanZ like family protein [Clostridium colicanis DSM 13634]MBE6043660.1 VanZ family protein [Clostridium thermopalmarium]PRR74285.1 VanZ like family protein [Clostridium thermopalmarium DSM 5974]PVZ22073.1 VanZ family protein [Clostridium thermopalmarium DSM 5974]